MRNSKCVLVAFACLAGTVTNAVADSEPLCPAFTITLSGTLSETAPLNGLDARGHLLSSADLPELSIPIPGDVNVNLPSYILRFVRSGEKQWFVEGKSTSPANDSLHPVDFMGPLATLKFDENGQLSQDASIKAFIPLAENQEQKATFEIVFRGLTIAASNDIVATDLTRSSEPCLPFGKVVISAEEAKKRTRILDPNGNDVTDKGYDEFGKLPEAVQTTE